MKLTINVNLLNHVHGRASPLVKFGVKAIQWCIGNLMTSMAIRFSTSKALIKTNSYSEQILKYLLKHWTREYRISIQLSPIKQKGDPVYSSHFHGVSCLSKNLDAQMLVNVKANIKWQKEKLILQPIN